MIIEKDEYKVLELLRKTGKILIQNGSEISRIEDTTLEIGKYYGYRTQCFATLTCLIFTVTNNYGEVHTLVERIDNRATNLDKVQRVYNLINNISNYEYNEFIDLLDEIGKDDSYNFLTFLVAHVLVAGFFVFIFDGKLADFLVGSISGIVLALIAKLCKYLRLNAIFSNVISSMACPVVPILAVKYGIISNVDTVIISSLMILVPGVAFINAIRDLFSGDLVTSLSRILEVLLIGTTLCVGTAIVLTHFIV